MFIDNQEEWENQFRQTWRDYMPLEDIPFKFDIELRFLYIMAAIVDNLNALIQNNY